MSSDCSAGEPGGGVALDMPGPLNETRSKRRSTRIAVSRQVVRTRPYSSALCVVVSVSQSVTDEPMGRRINARHF